MLNAAKLGTKKDRVYMFQIVPESHVIRTSKHRPPEFVGKHPLQTLDPQPKP